MRLSAYVNQHGVDAFTFDDFVFVGSRVARDPDRLILVGGQAIETWGVALNVPSPTGDMHPLTEDADWLGSKRDAQWLCDLLGADSTELQFAEVDEPGASSAVAFHRRPDGRVLLIDFLRAIIGPSNEEIKKLAVTVRVGGIQLNVLHPLLCLESRFANLQALESKRRGNGPLQAQWSIDIAAAYLRQTVALGAPPRQLIRACHRIAENAEYKAGRFCYVNFELDPLRAVTSDVVAAIGGRFQSDDWPRTLRRIEGKRRKWFERPGVLPISIARSDLACVSRTEASPNTNTPELG